MSAKRAIPRVSILTRFEPADLALIDAARGSVDRQSFVWGCVMGAARRIMRPENVARAKATLAPKAD